MKSALLLAPDFVLILLGAFLRRQLRLGDHFWAGAEKLVYYVLFPALLFSALARSHIEWTANAPVFFGGAAGMFLALCLAWLGVVLFRLPPMMAASRMQCAFRFNTYIGIAVAGSTLGEPGLALMGALCGVMVPLANAASVVLLARHQPVSLVSELMRNPLILATLTGIAWNLTGLSLPIAVHQGLGRLADAAVAIGLLSVGAALRPHGVSTRRGSELYLLAIKLLLLPACVYMLAPALGLEGLPLQVAVLWAALPTASSAYILTVRMGGDGPGVAWLISASTLAAMLTLPLWAAWLALPQ